MGYPLEPVHGHTCVLEYVFPDIGLREARSGNIGGVFRADYQSHLNAGTYLIVVGEFMGIEIFVNEGKNKDLDLSIYNEFKAGKTYTLYIDGSTTSGEQLQFRVGKGCALNQSQHVEVENDNDQSVLLDLKYVY